MSNKYGTLKFSVMEGNEDTNQNKSQGSNAVCVTVGGCVYRWGANEVKTLPDPLYKEAMDQDNRLILINES